MKGFNISRLGIRVIILVMTHAYETREDVCKEDKDLRGVVLALKEWGWMLLRGEVIGARAEVDEVKARNADKGKGVIVLNANMLLLLYRGVCLIHSAQRGCRGEDRAIEFLLDDLGEAIGTVKEGGGKIIIMPVRREGWCTKNQTK